MTWQAGIDRRLVARLVRTLEPGMIGRGLARRIAGAVEAMAGRLPLLARFPRAIERSRAGETPIVHALGPVVRPAPAAPAAASEGASGPRVVQVVAARVVERERLTERTIVERIAPQAPAPAPTPLAAPAPAPVPSPVRVEPAPGPLPEVPARRSRMGAPLARPALPHAVGTAIAKAARTLAAGTPNTRADHMLANHASPSSAVVPQRGQGAPASSAQHALREIAPVTVVPRRTTIAAATGALPVTAPDRAGSRVAVSRARALARLADPVAAHGLAAAAIVAPRRSTAGAQAGSLSHVAAAATAAPRSAAPAAPPVPAAPRSTAPAGQPAPTAPGAPSVPGPTARRAAASGPSIGVPLARADLPEIAAHVQRLLERQALHDRARRGLRR